MMLVFSSADLQRRTGEVQTSAEEAPVVITEYKRLRNVMLSVDEFVRLKRLAHEAIPDELVPKRPVTVRLATDHLGYDVRDLDRAARQMAEDALAGRTAGPVSEELRSVRARYGAVRS